MTAHNITARPKHGAISASVMCADQLNLVRDIKELERLGVEYLHIDVMDGQFVPNFTLGTDLIKLLHSATRIPLDIHLMITEPEKKLGYFELREGDIVSFHVEATVHAARLINAIKTFGAIPYPALNPATPLSAVEEIAEMSGGVLIMTVEPGYAGQKLIESTITKIKRLRSLYPLLPIEADGNVSPENALRMREAGTDIFVAGSSGLFIMGKPLEQSCQILRQAIK